jgi:hypothetical protein
MTRRIALLLVFLVLLTGCNLPSISAPQAWIDAPLDGSSLPLAPYEIVFHAYAAGNPAAVELSINGQAVALTAILDQPLVTVRYPWDPEHPGRYVITARTQDSEGEWSDEHTHIVEVIGEPTISPTPLVTVSPTATFTPIPAEHPTFTADTPANCREGTSILWRSLGITEAGSTYLIAGVNEDASWFFVQFSDTLQCWVSASTGRTTGDLSGVQVLHVELLLPSLTPSPVNQASYCSQFTKMECVEQHADRCVWEGPNPGGTCKDK